MISLSAGLILEASFITTVLVGSMAAKAINELVDANGRSWLRDGAVRRVARARMHGAHRRWGPMARIRLPPAASPQRTASRSGICRSVDASAGREAGARTPSLGERVLALATGKTRQELYAACPGDRPNHVGMAVQRHIRAGRIQERGGKLDAISTAAE
jgi:hypothetical protein